MNQTGAFMKETDQKYDISKKTGEAAQATKAWGISMWGRAKTLLNKNSSGDQAAGQAAAADAAPQEMQPSAPTGSEETKGQ